jgi:putative radical SAM enzyme (TIGR03279 family)
MDMFRSQPAQSLPLTGDGGLIDTIQPDSIADAIGLQPGDRVLAVGGVPLRDIIDYRFALAEAVVELTVWSGSEMITCEIEKDPDDDLGIVFSEPLFVPLRSCANACAFCFVRQMPPGLRSSLYVRDDDYRLSFLYGNFITLTNLEEADWHRIGEQHLSPLYISVHTTDADLRARLMGRRAMPDVLAQIRRLGAMGIRVHTQIVACPGWNDGPALLRTINDLAALFPVVQSIAIVPVGLTRYARHGKTSSQHSGEQGSINIHRYGPAEACAIVEMARACGNQYRQEMGLQMVYPADEFFLLCGEPLPSVGFYDGYPQYANGVGMTRDFLNEWARARHHLPRTLSHPLRVALVCGTLFAPTLQQLLTPVTIGGLEMCVVPVRNRFFGDTVTVSGLLTGQDVLAALQSGSYDRVVLPRSMVDHAGHQTLDGYRVEDIGEATGRPVELVGTASELVHLLQNLA